MKKARDMFIKNLHYFFLIGVIALGLMTIVGSGGGDDGGGGDGQTQPQAATEQYVRNMSAYVLIDAINTIYNLYIPGSGGFWGIYGGYKELLDADCPNGGTVSIVGDCSFLPNITNIDFTYTFKNCLVAEEDGIVTFANGSCHQKGMWTENTKQVFYSGESTMNMRIFDPYGQEYARDYVDCEFSISEELSAGDWSYSGFWCEEEISW